MPVRYHDSVHLVEFDLHAVQPARANAASSEPHRAAASVGSGIPGAPLGSSVTGLEIGAQAAGDGPDRLVAAVERSWLPRSIISGFLATILMSILFVVAFAFARLVGSQLPAAGVAGVLGEWLLALTTNRVLDLATGSLYLAGTLHIVVGVMWAMVYASVAEPRLAGPSWLKGVKFAILPWTLSLVVFLPLVGGGLFGASIGAGPLPAIGNFILHLVYGATLGAVYGPLGDVPADDFSRARQMDSRWVTAREEQAMARGIVFGAALGALIGITGATASIDVLFGAPPLAFFAASVVLGATFGCFIGSMAGLTAAESRAA